MKLGGVLPYLAGAVLALAMAQGAAAQELADRVHEYTLDNGLRVIMVEQPIAPVITFNLMFDVGGIDEPDGLGGIAHMVEHMAFKGTPTIGSLDPQAEAGALARVEVEALSLEYLERTGASEEALAEAQERFAAARAASQELAAPNVLDQLIDANGGVGLNASTGYDRTAYLLALPANRLELYARVYADILMNTTFRAFYEERDVVHEERRQRSEDDPQGFLFEAFLDTAFEAHPYGRPLIGAAGEIEGYLASQAEAFFELYYRPGRAVLVMVGDLQPERDIEVIRRYFGVLENAPDLRPAILREPPQQAERRQVVRYDAEPQLMVGYHKPTYPEREAYVLDVISGILSSGRTSRLFERMVLGEQIALDVFTDSGFPGQREANLFVFYGLPRAPSGPQDLEAVLYEELERLGREPVGEQELEKVKNQVRAAFIRALDSGAGLAEQLAYYELFLGGWENIVDYADIIDSVTAEEIQEVARATFGADQRTVVTLLPETAKGEKR